MNAPRTLPATSARAELPVLHPAFALTGVLHAIGGPVLPSLALRLHFNDSQSGLLFLLYFIGTSLGAVLCTRKYARLTALGFLLASLCAAAISISGPRSIWPLFLLLGVGVGIPMTTVSIIAGRRFGSRSAAPLTLLNFSWSAGAVLAPLLAARLLVHYDYRVAYVALACAAALCFAVCARFLRDPELIPVAPSPARRQLHLRWILLFAFLTFLEVGIENTTVTWLATYALRTSSSGAAHAAAASSLYWIGFLASRGLSSMLLLRISPMRVLAPAVIAGIVGSSMLIASSSPMGRNIAMVLLGAALAPIFPLLLSQFFARVPNPSDSRWVLACCGFGGSVLPWLVGFISTATGNLRAGLTVVPAALLLVLCAIPALRINSTSTQ